jgi:hypothetical protein
MYSMRCVPVSWFRADKYMDGQGLLLQCVLDEGGFVDSSHRRRCRVAVLLSLDEVTGNVGVALPSSVTVVLISADFQGLPSGAR